MVVLTCDLSTCELETRGYSQLFGKSEANLSYIRPLKNKMKKKKKEGLEPDVVSHVFNPRTWEAEAGGPLSLRTVRSKD